MKICRPASRIFFAEGDKCPMLCPWLIEKPDFFFSGPGDAKGPPVLPPRFPRKSKRRPRGPPRPRRDLAYGRPQAWNRDQIFDRCFSINQWNADDAPAPWPCSKMGPAFLVDPDHVRDRARWSPLRPGDQGKRSNPPPAPWFAVLPTFKRRGTWTLFVCIGVFCLFVGGWGCGDRLDAETKKDRVPIEKNGSAEPPAKHARAHGHHRRPRFPADRWVAGP